MSRLLLLVWAVLLCVPMQAHAACEGDFPDPIADFCWSCIFPLRVGGVEVYGAGQLDQHTSNRRVCLCGWPPTVHLPVEFWEPVRLVEVTRTPFCLPILDGLQLDAGISARVPGARTGSAGSEGTVAFAFYQVHWYINPLLHWLGVLLDFDCLERAGLDLAYVSELDPTWEDDQLAALIAPEVLLTGSLQGLAACAADCVATTANGWSQDEFWWCAGCVGELLPLSGNVAGHISGRQSSSLLASRLAMRMHRLGATQYTHGRKAMCQAGWRDVQLHKTAYKMSMILPRAQQQRNDRCCEPLGVSPELWASGSEWPVSGEDFAYVLFRKRSCCVGLTR